MKHKKKQYLKLIIFSVFAISITILILLATKKLFNNYSYYQEEKIQVKNSYYYYPKFNNKIDNNINDFIKSVNNEDIDVIKYSITFIDSYVNVLFKLYKNNAIIDYKTIIFNSEYKEVNINEIVTDHNILIDKIKLYIENYNIFVADDFFEKAKFSYLFKENELLIYLSQYDEHQSTLMVNINYNEINDILNLKNIKLDKNYNLITVPPTTTTTAVDENYNKKIVAFTFDDGPSYYTLDILNVLEAYGANATFFEVGYMMNSKPSITIEVYNRGFEIGNHTSDHSKLTKLTSEKILEKINNIEVLYNSITGSSLKLVRPPYGAYNDLVKTTINYPLILWSVDSRDWESRNTIEIVNKVLENIKDGDIVLFHDLYPSTLEAIKILVPTLYENDYKIVNVSKLFEIKNIVLENNKVYRCACN